MRIRVVDECEYQRSDGYTARTVACAKYIRIDPLYYLSGSTVNITYSLIIWLILKAFWRDLMDTQLKKPKTLFNSAALV